MAESVPYEQILQELAIKKGLKPWQIAFSGPQAASPAPAAPPAQSIADQPMQQAMQREKLHQGLAPMAALANPEESGGGGLIKLLMALMGR